MQKILVLLICSATCSCNSPPREFWNIPATRVTVGGDTFDVRVKENEALALRINSAYRPRLSATAPQAITAIEQVSGCKTVGVLTGDPILIRSAIDCKY